MCPLRDRPLFWNGAQLTYPLKGKGRTEEEDFLFRYGLVGTLLVICSMFRIIRRIEDHGEHGITP
jgi:hypothetical protein